MMKDGGLDTLARPASSSGNGSFKRIVDVLSSPRALQSIEPFDPKDITARLRAALDQAEAFVARMPTDKLRLLFLEAGEVVQPDPDRLDAHQTHAGQRRGQWPSSPEISAAMFG